MPEYVLTKKALEDLSGTWHHTVDVWSAAQAEKYYWMLLDSFRELSEGKVTGRSFPEIHADIRGYQIGQHIIFYRSLATDQIEIARVLHQRIDLKNRLKE